MAVSELVNTAFDVLAMSAHRADSEDRSFIARSYIVSKIPVIAETLSAMTFNSLNLEFVITQALSNWDSNMQLQMAQDFEPDRRDGSITEARREFLLSCASHGIIQESSIPQLLGEDLSQNVRAGGRIQRHALLSDYRSNHQRVENIMTGIERMDGNAATHVEALTEVRDQVESPFHQNLVNQCKDRPRTLRKP